MKGRFSKTEIREKVLQALHLVQLDGYEDRPAPFLSGAGVSTRSKASI